MRARDIHSILYRSVLRLIKKLRCLLFLNTSPTVRKIVRLLYLTYVR